MLRLGRERSFDLIRGPSGRSLSPSEILLALAPPPQVAASVFGGWPRWLSPSGRIGGKRSSLVAALTSSRKRSA